MEWMVVMRGLALLFGLQGKSKAADNLNRLADMAEAGVEVDAYMKKVAEDFKAGMERSWEEILADVNENVDEFLDEDDVGSDTLPAVAEVETDTGAGPLVVDGDDDKP